jgi:hypothetical protein
MSIFNTPINPNISDSLTIRQELMGKTTRTSKELTFLNSKTNWVSLKSGVDINNDKGNLAKANVLEGGTLSPDGKLKSGINIGGNSGSYNNNNVLGIRPMPGITSVSIENIGAYGSTRRATINFQCWDVSQLEVLEQLYMRPGYLVLLEFGRTIYLEKDGSLQQTERKAYYDFFSKKNIVLLDELNKLHKLATDSKGNYDTLLGYIVNYGWQVRPDGGYDCKTEIISTGEILESLKANYSLATDVNFSGINNNIFNFQGKILPSIDIPSGSLSSGDLIKINQDYSSNILAGVIRELHTICKIKSPLPSDPNQINIKLNNTFSSIDIAKLYYSSTDDPQKALIQNTSKQNYYITLESFINVLNELIIPHVNGSEGNKSLGALTKLSVKDRMYTEASGSSLKCLYNAFMTSVDPDVCFIKNEYWNNVIKGLSIDINVDALPIVPQGYEAILNNPDAKELRRKINNWIIESSKTNDHSNIITNINEDYKKWKAKNSQKSDNEYFKYFQQIYQTVRGGLNEGQDLIKIRYDRDGNAIADEKYKSPNIRAWNYLRNNPTLVNNLRNQLGVDKDKRFIDLLTNIKAGASNGGNSPDQLFIIEGLNKVSNDINLDNALNAQQSIVNTAIQNAKKAEEIKTKLNSISEDYQLILKSIPLSFIDETSVTGRKFGIIGNIYLNLKHLYYLATNINITTQDPSGKNTLSLSHFITELMKNIQSSTGNVNDFELHIDDRDGIGRIIDLNYLNYTEVKNENTFEFEIGSNKSIIRDLKLESKIFSDQVSMMAISAQASSGRLGYNNTTMVDYNKGIINRLIPSINSPSVTNNNYDSVVLVSSLSNLISQFFIPFTEDYYKDGKTDNVYGGNFNASISPSCQYYLRDIINFFTAAYNTDNKNSSFIPAYLSITIDGIGGLVIGNIISVDKTFIPKSYKNNDNKKLKYVIMKINQELNQNDWITTIDAIPLPPIPEQGNQIEYPLDFTVIISYDPYTNSSQTSVIPTISISDTISKVYIPVRDKVLVGKPNGLKILVTAQTQIEGFKPGNPNFDLNNPGNFKAQVGNIKPAAVNQRGGFVKYNSLEDGIKTQEAQINSIISGGSRNYPKDATLEQYINKYAPSSDNNDPFSYINLIISYFKKFGYNISKNDPLSKITSLK